MVLLQGGIATFGIFFVLLAVLVPFGLYALVRTEHDGRETMSRAEGERVARRDSRDERR